MIRFLLFFLIATSLFSSKVEYFKWKKDVTYTDFLQQYEIPRRQVLDNLDEDDRRLVEEIRAGVNCNFLRSDDGEIEQVLIPLNDELQIHLYKANGRFHFEAIPIVCETKTGSFMLKIKTNPSIDIKNETGSINLVSIFLTGFGTSLDFTALRKGDRLAMVYEQKYRLGRPFSMPTLKAGMIEVNKRPHYIYLNKDDRYYDKKGKQIESFLLARPVQNSRISSRFTKRRYHPVLKKWKAHLGMDYAARRGTPVVAASSGRIIHIGRLGSYGKLIKLRHKDGFETRYAHLNGYRRGLYNGKKVSKGQIIGYVGSTGRSTGPHLHFELRKHGQAINPAKRVQLTTKTLKGKAKKAFEQLVKNYDEQLNLHLENQTKFIKKQKLTNLCYFNNECETIEVASVNE